MNYLVPLFDCLLLSKGSYTLINNVKYEIENDNFPAIIFSYENILPFVFDQLKVCENCLKVNFGFDNYFFLFPQKVVNNHCVKFNFKNNEVFINISATLKVSINGEQVIEKVVDNLSYENYELVGDFCLIYFTGKRNFLLVLKNKEVSFANYYDECNFTENEKVFMCRLYDSLNHGRVCHIKDNTLESYLVYLDNEDLNLKEDFVPHIFLDCLLAENYKYCNELLCEEIKLKDEKSVKDFFPEFDYYYPASKDEFILIKKNTLAGIYKFEVNNKLIINIINLHH